MSSRSQGTKNRHPSRKQRSGRKRGASDAKAPVLGQSGNGHAAPTPAQFGARAPLAGKALAPEVPPLSLRGQFLAPEMRQAKISRVKARPAPAARVDSPPPRPGQPPKILSAVIRPTSALGTALSVSFSMGWNGPPLLEVANDDMEDIRASQPQPIDYSVIVTAEPAEAAVADTQAEPAAPYLHTEAGDTISPPCRCPGMPNLWPRRNRSPRALIPEIPASPCRAIWHPRSPRRGCGARWGSGCAAPGNCWPRALWSRRHGRARPPRDHARGDRADSIARGKSPAAHATGRHDADTDRTSPHDGSAHDGSGAGLNPRQNLRRRSDGRPAP